MRKAIYLALGITFLIASSSMAARYTLNSFFLEYGITGVNEGTEKVYVDKKGELEGRHTKTKTSFMGFTNTIEQSQYLDGTYSYSYDPKTGIAQRMNISEFTEGMRSKGNMRDFSKQVRKELNAQNRGKKKILNFPCVIWFFPDFNTETCIYKDSVPLEIKSGFGGFDIHYIATKFQPNARIPRDMVQVPKTAQIRDVGNLHDIMGGQGTAYQPTGGNEQEVKGLGGLMKMFSGANKQQQQQAVPQPAPDDISQREIDLREKELELERMKLEMEREKLEQQKAQSAQQKGNALDDVNKAVNTTNKATNTLRSIGNIFGR